MRANHQAPWSATARSLKNDELVWLCNRRSAACLSHARIKLRRDSLRAKSPLYGSDLRGANMGAGELASDISREFVPSKYVLNVVPLYEFMPFSAERDVMIILLRLRYAWTALKISSKKRGGSIP
jgi:hypothetical protein